MSVISSFKINNNSSSLKKPNESSKIYFKLRNIINKSINKIKQLNKTVKPSNEISELMQKKNKANNIYNITNKYLEEKNEKYHIYDKLDNLHLNYIINNQDSLLTKLKNIHHDVINKIDNIIDNKAVSSPKVEMDKIYNNSNDEFIYFKPRSKTKTKSKSKSSNKNKLGFMKRKSKSTLKRQSPLLNYGNIYRMNDKLNMNNPMYESRSYSSPEQYFKLERYKTKIKRSHSSPIVDFNNIYNLQNDNVKYRDNSLNKGKTKKRSKESSNDTKLVKNLAAFYGLS